MATQIKIRRDTAANWTSANPVLASGEFFYAERGKGQKQAWLDKIAEIDARLPYPEKPKGK